MVDAYPTKRPCHLARAATRFGYPKAIRVDQGSEFVSRDLDLWAYANDVTLDFSRPGKPTNNAFIEAFNGPPGPNAFCNRDVPVKLDRSLPCSVWGHASVRGRHVGAPHNGGRR